LKPVKLKQQKYALHVTVLDGNGPAPNFPKIGGQHRTYLAKALQDYKSGSRKDPIMAGMAASLSAADIEKLGFLLFKPNRQPEFTQIKRLIYLYQVLRAG
jgi:hypothetical protein